MVNIPAQSVSQLLNISPMAVGPAVQDTSIDWGSILTRGIQAFAQGRQNQEAARLARAQAQATEQETSRLNNREISNLRASSEIGDLVAGGPNYQPTPDQLASIVQNWGSSVRDPEDLAQLVASGVGINPETARGTADGAQLRNQLGVTRYAAAGDAIDPGDSLRPEDANTQAQLGRDQETALARLVTERALATQELQNQGSATTARIGADARVAAAETAAEARVAAAGSQANAAIQAQRRGLQSSAVGPLVARALGLGAGEQIPAEVYQAVVTRADELLQSGTATMQAAIAQAAAEMVTTNREGGILGFGARDVPALNDQGRTYRGGLQSTAPTDSSGDGGIADTVTRGAAATQPSAPAATPAPGAVENPIRNPIRLTESQRQRIPEGHEFESDRGRWRRQGDMLIPVEPQ